MEQRIDSIEFAYRGRIYTIWAMPGGDGRRWVFGCRELSLVRGSFASAQDALLGGIEMVVRGETPRAELAA
ncbi:MAG: hypothetical protein IRY97_07155 [Thermomicrobiaceae bacterium]|nr:hypothetical protein [Thermomicrobiaceae bacterium]